ncbi:hypothetical protein F4802DRAFT_593834 [Xylaria palmicola]|nr:hypothetical protein F4802DRAFT_593834 [Xylaria palmicola]
MLSYARLNYHRNATIPLRPTIDNQEWNVTGTESAEYIEALSFHADGTNGPDDVCRYGRLVGDEILNWVTQSRDYAALNRLKASPKFRGGIRLLILERLYYQPPSFPVNKETFLAIEKQFNLPENTLLALSNECGMSTHVLDVDEEAGVPRRLSMIMKAHQKFQVGNYGLAFSYDFATGLCTGILHGTGVTQHGDDFAMWSKKAGAELFEHIQVAAHRSWAHPLFLPVTLLQHHLLRADYFCTVVLANKHTNVQNQLGTMRAGRLFGTHARHIATELPVQQAKISLRELTVEMSGLAFDVTWFCAVADWECSCLRLLQEVLAEMESLDRKLKDTKMRARIQYLASLAESIQRHNTGMKENSQVDMNVLYSVISQVDNRLNAKMAAAASRDSAAMKTLAFLTTLFLPGTFVATIFSTGLFNWQGDGKVVSDLFWVYWALAVPLTIVVGAGWRLWWSLEKKHFDRDISVEIKAIDGNGDVAGGKRTPPAA